MTEKFTADGVEVVKLPTGHLTAFDASDGLRYLVVAPDKDNPLWEIYLHTPGQMFPKVNGQRANRVLAEYFGKEEA